MLGLGLRDLNFRLTVKGLKFKVQEPRSRI
jgi:hypothetical protein